MTQLLYPIFYKAFGIRRLQSLLSPMPFTVTSLPRDSMVHFVSTDSEHLDIDTSKLYYGSTTRKILIDYPTKLTSTLGNPKEHFVDTRPFFKPFLRENRKFRFLKDGHLQINDALTLFVCNYSYASKIYRYPAIPMASYYKWFNSYKTIFDNIETITKVNSKNHFVFVDIPKDIPGFGLLNIYKDNTTTAMLRIFDDQSKLFILEMFKWLDEKRSELNTIFSGLSVSTLSKTNLVFNLTDGRSTVLNLGFLNSWIKGQDNATDISVVSQTTNIMMQKALLKFLLTLLSNNAVPVETETSSETDVKVVDPDDESEDEELKAAQRDYDQQHDSDGDEADGHEYEDALSYINRVSITTKVDKPVVANKEIVKANTKNIVEDFDTEISIDTQLEQLDQDISVLDDITARKLLQKGLKVEKSGLIDTKVFDTPEASVYELQQKIYTDEGVHVSLRKQIETQVDFGLITASDYRALNKDIEAFSKSKDPYGSGKPVHEAKIIAPEVLQLNKKKSTIDSSHLVQDKSMLQSSLLSFDHDYINHVMKKDMLSMTDGLQKAGIVIRGHDIETVHSALGGYEIHTLDIKPIDGQASTLHFKIPVVSEDGVLNANGSRYFLRKLRVDIPIRKIKPTEVALTSYYGKTFVKLNPRKSNNSVEWLVKELNIAGMNQEGFIKRVNPAKVFDNNFEAPFIYNALADNFKSVVTETFTLQFDYTERHTLVNELRLKALEKDGARVVGKAKNGQPIVVSKNNIFHLVDQDNNIVSSGTIYSLLHLHETKAPVDYCEVNIFSKAVPVAVILGYTLGFKNLLKFLEAKYRTTEGRQDKELQSHEYVISFKDINYIFSRTDRVASMILSGFNEFDKQIKQFEVDDFNHKDIYLNLLETKGLSSIYMREIDLMQQLFIDPITKGILEQMKEPVTFNGLLVRSAELLQTYHHPDSQDMQCMRIRGYERISGAVYKNMVTSIRQFRNKNIAGRSRIDMSPYQVWTSIMEDPAMKIVEDINPIQNLKESEIITYSGEGGRGKNSMNKASRAYHKNDMGIVSEATVDSSDVGVNAYLSANPRFKDLRGMPNLEKGPIDPSSLISTSALLSPGSDSDDLKRVNFVSIQHGHSLQTDGYHQPVIRTGYEYVIANRTTDTFACTAKQDGKVVSITPKGIIVELEDKTRKGVTLGRVYGKAEGSVYPHDIVTDLKEGQKFTKGTPIAYNKGFFERDSLDPTKIIMKNSVLAKVALFESSQTHEDSCAISPKLSSKLIAKTTKIKSYVIDFKQNLLRVAKPGQAVSPKTLLMLIEDEITSSTTAFDEETLAALQQLSNQAPKAGHLGKLDKIEVFYHGDKVDMSSGLKALCDQSDKLFAEIAAATSSPVITGQVNDDYRVSGIPLTLDKAEVRFYITIDTSSGTGDKLVAANQMKSVIGEVLDYSVKAEDGTEIEMLFGCRSILARIVNSPFIMGTSATLLQVIQKKAVDIYFKA